ncbi:hypothetical protein AGMMS50256_09360 [Betaproteobacteria bacterium]|nr:hypothetical protein AGMMS50256_09360 [Betaproteobacteria bacterium]
MTISTKQWAVRFFVVTLVVLMALCAWMPSFTTKANEQVDAGLKRAVATYATARLLNGIISVVQGTEVSAAPAGVGMTFSPGEILDPLNDLVEQFSQVMLMAMIAFGIEKVLLTVGASWVISLALSLIAAIWCLLHVQKKTEPRWLARLLLVLFVTRFAMPVSLMATDVVFEHFMASDYQESQEVLKTVQGEASELGTVAVEEKQGFWEKLKSTTVDAFAEARAKLESLKQAAESAVDHIIKLMGIFVLETIVLPILFIWALFGIGRSVFETPPLRMDTGT